MMVIFSDLIEKVMEVFMDDFSIYGKMFEDCLANLDKVLKSPDWHLPFEIMCDASDYAVGAVLG
jgi:hypothetical protein